LQEIKKALRRLLAGAPPRNALPRHDQLPPGFNAALYLQLNPDVQAAGVDPVAHYLQHGAKEGRTFAMPKLVTLKQQADEVRRQPLLLICHEASRSGAPILGLNLAQQLAKEHDVVVVLLGAGSLVEDFTAAAPVVFLCQELRFAASDIGAETVVQDLCGRFGFVGAIVNSVESRAVLAALWRAGVPTVSLLHEFAAYARPANAFPRALFWSTKAVFSTRITRDDAFQRLELRDASNVAILPQGKCVLTAPQSEQDGTREPRLSWSLANSARPLVHVLGVGSVEYRKGVDLFIECARQMRALDPTTDYRFHWVGGGYDPGGDLQYSVYLADQVRRSGLASCFQLLAETDKLEDVYAQAHLFLLTSRLDPLPNVAIDAAMQGLPLLCFAKTTGIADFLAEAGLAESLVADYLSTMDMACKAVALGNSPRQREAVSATLQASARAAFSMEHYVGALRGLLEEAGRQRALEKRDASEILRAQVLRSDVCVHPAHPQLGEQLAVSDAAVAGLYVRSWATGLYRRKPFPGFHPAIYRERTSLPAGRDPLAHYLQAGRPEGPWNCPVLTPEQPVAPAEQLEVRRIALHIHAYYVDLLGEIVHRLALNSARPDLFVSVTSAEQKATAEAVLAAYTGRVVRVEVVPNRGRDLGPMLSMFAGDTLSGYELAGHLHTKKSLDVQDRSLGQTWYGFLLEHLIGGEASGPMLDRIVSRMAPDAGPDMAFPEDPYVFGDEANAAQVAEFAKRMGWPQPPAHFRFPVGSMFWARPAVLRPLLDAGFTVEDYPEEPLPYDGTILHVLERALGLAAMASPRGLVVTNVPGVTR
jgi:glycosyltransferase involved in cell wall biosynthesis